VQIATLLVVVWPMLREMTGAETPGAVVAMVPVSIMREAMRESVQVVRDESIREIADVRGRSRPAETVEPAPSPPG